MERISKKQFEDILCESESLFIGVTHYDASVYLHMTGEKPADAHWRHVVKRQTNRLCFSDDSSLCTDQNGTTFWSTCDGMVVCRKIDGGDGYLNFVWYYVPDNKAKGD